jgi:hypothetical protein
LLPFFVAVLHQISKVLEVSKILITLEVNMNKKTVYIYKFSGYTEGETSKLIVDETDGFTEEWYKILRQFDKEEYDLFCENSKNNLPFYDEICLCNRDMCQSAENAYLNRGVKERIQEAIAKREERNKRRIRRVLAKIPLKQRDLAKSIFWKGLSSTDIAESESASISSVSHRTDRLYETLRKLLKHN